MFRGKRRTRRWKPTQKAIGLFTDGYSKEYLIDEAWGLHGLTDDEINGLVAWVEELTKGREVI